MLKKVLSIVTSLTLTTLCLNGCTSDGTKKELDKVTIAEVARSVFYAPQYAAITQGFFEEEAFVEDEN